MGIGVTPIEVKFSVFGVKADGLIESRKGPLELAEFEIVDALNQVSLGVDLILQPKNGTGPFQAQS